jgi:hypothetical protein
VFPWRGFTTETQRHDGRRGWFLEDDSSDAVFEDGDVEGDEKCQVDSCELTPTDRKSFAWLAGRGLVGG